MNLSILAPSLRDLVVGVLVAMLTAGTAYLTTSAPRQLAPVVASAPILAAPTPEVTPTRQAAEPADLATAISALTKELAAIRAERQVMRAKKI